MSRRAVFLDRDGTLVQARHYPTRPEELVLHKGVAGPLAALKASGFALVMATNQSGIARAFFTSDDLDQMHRHLRRTLAAVGAELDGVYACPHHPEGTVDEYAIACSCRKPQPGMLLQAESDLDLDLADSWFVGDILDDVEAGNRAGCRTVLVDLGTESRPIVSIRNPDFMARDTRHALQIILSLTGHGQSSELDYLPASWSDHDPPGTAQMRPGLVASGASERAGG
jgi:D-glycero-D-manno-heptose 1,7-bisphosphate phosphatase